MILKFKILLCSIFIIGMVDANDKISHKKTVETNLDKCINWIKTHKKATAGIVIASIYTCSSFYELLEKECKEWPNLENNQDKVKGVFQCLIATPFNVLHMIIKDCKKLKISNSYIQKLDKVLKKTVESIFGVIE
ncbi:hypothetical protein M1446_03580 [Candidatus Dependentiae bacterium]|nr:hypothetical protein [Candidatus Dependentiae bacterium]